LLCSTPIHPAERCLPQPKPRGLGRLRLPAGFDRKSPKIGGTVPWSRDAQMPGAANVAVLHPHSSGGALPPLAEAPVDLGACAYRPVLAGKARKSGEPAPGAEVPKYRSPQILLCSTPIPPAERCLPQPKPRGFGRLRLPAGFGRKSTEIGGTGPWSRDAQMPGGTNFAAFHPQSSGGALPPLTEAPRIWAPAVTGRFWPEKSDNRGEPANCVKEDGDAKPTQW
jgi:hypothetical protein